MNALRSTAALLSVSLTLAAGCAAPSGDDTSSSSDAVEVGAGIVGSFTVGFYDAEGASLAITPASDLRQVFSWRKERADGDNSSCVGYADAFGRDAKVEEPQNRVRDTCTATFRRESDDAVMRTSGGDPTTYRRLDPKRLAGTYVPTLDGKPFDGIGRLVLGEAEGHLAKLTYSLESKTGAPLQGTTQLDAGRYGGGAGWAMPSLACESVELHPVRRGEGYEIRLSTIVYEPCEYALPHAHDVVFVKR